MGERRKKVYKQQQPPSYHDNSLKLRHLILLKFNQILRQTFFCVKFFGGSFGYDV